nr:hypothetical protein [Tanacetum cinerariifolium]
MDMGESHISAHYIGKQLLLRRKALNFCTLFAQRGNGVDVVVLVESIRAIVISLLIRHMVSIWFSSMEDAMLENCPWFIRKNLLILEKWNLNVNLSKEDVGNVLIWVKLYGVPVIAFNQAMLELRSRFGLMWSLKIILWWLCLNLLGNGFIRVMFVLSMNGNLLGESYKNEEYDYDPYDNDIYEGQDIPDRIQDIYDNLDIKVRGHQAMLELRSRFGLMWSLKIILWWLYLNLLGNGFIRVMFVPSMNGNLLGVRVASDLISSSHLSSLSSAREEHSYSSRNKLLFSDLSSLLLS